MSFCQYLECQAPRTNPKRPHRKANPPTENFLAMVLICTPPYLTLYGWNLVVSSARWDRSGPTAIGNNVCSDSTGKVETSAFLINFDGSSADVTLFSSQKMLLVVLKRCFSFGKLWLVADNLHLGKGMQFCSMADLSINYVLIFCQNKINSTTLRQTTNDERLNLW